MFHIRQEIDFKGMFYIRQELDFKGMFLIRHEKDVGVNANRTDSIASFMCQLCSKIQSDQQCAAVIVQKKENFKTHARACKERGTLRQEPGITSIIASQLCSKLQFQQDHKVIQLMTLNDSMQPTAKQMLCSIAEELLPQGPAEGDVPLRVPAGEGGAQLQIPARQRKERV
jgi:hypothetical protein